jgi:outer membrane biosynthesis protein TonB
LWDEEDDGEDQRPTIVNERPAHPARAAGGLPPLARMSLVERLIAKGELEDAGELNNAYAAAWQGPSAVMAPLTQSRSAARESSSPIELAAQQAADAEQRDSTEILQDSEIDLLRLSEPGSPTAGDRAAALNATIPLGTPLPQGARRAPTTEPLESPRRVPKTEPFEAPRRVPQTARLADIPADEAEELLLVQPARRPRNQSQPTQRLAPAISDAGGFRDREVTERISIPPLASSIAPAARTVRPQQRPQRGMGGWQLALVATLLIGAGVGVARLRRESAAAASAASARSEASTARVEPTPAAAFEPEAPQAAEPALPAPADGPAVLEPAPTLEAVGAVPPAAIEPEQKAVKPAPAGPKSTRTARAAQESSTPEPEGSQPAGSIDKEPAQASVAAARHGRESAQSDAKPSASAMHDLPAQPSRDEVRAALNAVIPELQKCIGERHGTADVTLTVRAPGSVSYAVVAGSFAGTPEGSCIARAVKLAKFPAFREPTVRVSYPFQL